MSVKAKNTSEKPAIKLEQSFEITCNEIKKMFLYGSAMCKALPLLLKDQTTNKNIVWATDTYENHGVYYHKEQQMLPDFCINLILDGILLPRIQKDKLLQQKRTKTKAEVFTPSWVCNKMNNYCDEQWFGRKTVFNQENEDNTWTPITEKIIFGDPVNKRYAEWQRYVLSKRVEITCGEAPYIVSRYDATTGEELPIFMRIGVLDRKLRIVNENTNTEKDWYQWTCKAYQSTYGFEYQGDNLLFARINLVQTFIDYYKDRFGKNPDLKKIKRIAEIVSWNFWQMDGLTDAVPYGIPCDNFKYIDKEKQLSNKRKVFCNIKDWRSEKVVRYRNIKGDENNEV